MTGEPTKSFVPQRDHHRYGGFVNVTTTSVRNLAETQASLRRLAILIAEGAPPDTLFAAVIQESRRYFVGSTARMIRCETNGTATLLANEGTCGRTSWWVTRGIITRQTD
jgi:hypothetical protein